MKKIALTLIAVAFGSSIALAQSTPEQGLASIEKTPHTRTLVKMSDRVEEKAERRTISIYELPETVQDQLKHSALAGHTIVSMTEVQAPYDDEAPLQYELVLQEDAGQTLTEPGLVVRYDQYGELLSQQEISATAMKKIEEEVEATL